jgi:hypothetical protein
MKHSTMHQCVFGLSGLMAVFAVALAIAMQRVSQTKEFAGQPLNSQTCETRTQSGSRTVVSWLETCRHLRVDPSIKP